MDNITKNLSQAIPTIDQNGNVKSWQIAILFSCENYAKEFIDEFDVHNLAKTPENFSVQELLNLSHVTTFEKCFNSICEHRASSASETVVRDFNINSLS